MYVNSSEVDLVECATVGCYGKVCRPAQQKPPNIDIGDIVRRKDGLPMPTLKYIVAFVVSISPFVLKSKDGECTWTSQNIDDYKFVGKAEKSFIEKLIPNR